MTRDEDGPRTALWIGADDVASRVFPVIFLATMAVPSTAVAQKPAASVAASSAAERAAVERLRAPAAAGDAAAQFELGQAYRRGRGVPEDRVLAETWLRRAAIQGHVRASDNLGLVLFQANKKTEAVPWLEKSAARGEPRAQLVLGTMLFNGDTVARNYPRAYALVLRSTGAGLRPAAETLTQMDKYISPQERQEGVALASQMGGAQVAATTGSAPAPAPASVRTPAPAPAPRAVSVPASTVAPAPAPVARALPAPTTTVVAASAPRPVPTPVPRPLPAPTANVATAAPRPVSTPTASGRYRIQLGAFRDAANARALWSRVGGQIGGTPSYVEGNGITRLQAGPYPTSADAARACAAAKRVGTDCAVLGN